MKTVLSFDVGIVNLAYCIIEKSSEKDFKISKWDIINIDDDKIKCSHETKKSHCKKNAKYQLLEKYMCSTHYNDLNKKINKDLIDNLITCEFDMPQKCKNCKTLGSHKIKKHPNNEYDDCFLCDKHFEKSKKDYLSSNLPKKIKNQNSNYQGINSLSINLFKKLDELKDDFLKVDEVLIENQPSLLNPTMKTISSMLYSYFSIRGIIDKELTKSNITKVYFISPQNKLKINKDITNQELAKDDIKTKRDEYVITKDLGKKYCRGLVECNKDYIDILDKHSKKDDLCDSFLQGFYYLFYKNNEDNFDVKFKDILDKVSKDIDKNNLEKEKKKIIKESKKIKK